MQMMQRIKIDSHQSLILIQFPLHEGRLNERTKRPTLIESDNVSIGTQPCEYEREVFKSKLQKSLQSFVLESEVIKQNRVLFESHQYLACQVQLIIKEQDGQDKRCIKCIWIPVISELILSFIQSCLKPSKKIKEPCNSNQGKYKHMDLIKQFDNINKLCMVYDSILGEFNKFFQSIKVQFNFQVSSNDILHVQEESCLVICGHEHIYYIDDRLSKLTLESMGNILEVAKCSDVQKKKQLLQKMKSQIIRFQASQDTHMKNYHELKLLIFLFAIRHFNFHRKQEIQAKISSFLSETFLIQIQNQQMKERFRQVIVDFIQQEKCKMLQQLYSLWIQVTKHTQMEGVVAVFNHWKNIYPFRKLSLSELILVQFRNTFQNQWVSKIKNFLRAILQGAVPFNLTSSNNQDLFVPSGDNLFKFFSMMRLLHEIHNALRQVNGQAVDFVVDFMKICLCHMVNDIQGLKTSQKYLNWIQKRRIYLLLVIYSWTNAMIAESFYQQSKLKEIRSKSVAKLRQFKLAYQQQSLKFIEEHEQQFAESQRCTNKEVWRWPVGKDMKDLQDERDFFEIIDKVHKLEDSSIQLKRIDS